MSLINNMLNALEANKKDESDHNILSSIKPITKRQQGASKWRILFWIIFLAIVASTILYYNPNVGGELKQFITNIKTKHSAPQTSTKADLDNNEIAAQPEISEPKIIQPLTKLQNINVTRRDNNTILTLILSGSVQYKISDQIAQQIYITLDKTTVDGNLPVSLDNSFIAALNTKQDKERITITIDLLPGTELDDTQLTTEPHPHLQLIFSNPQLTKGSMHKSPVRLSPQQQEQKNYQEIQNILAENKTLEAVRKLRIFVGDHPDNLESRALLASLLIQNGEFKQANSVLAIGLNKHSNHIPFIKLKAYVLIKQSNTKAAIKLLETHLTDDTNDTEYTALLAALYQKNGEFMEAAHIYNELAKKQPQKTAWWIGLGLALESADKHNAAQEAYLRAYNNSDVPPELSAFLNDKIKKP